MATIDCRSTDTYQLSTVDDAVTIIHAFANAGPSRSFGRSAAVAAKEGINIMRGDGPWLHLQRDVVAEALESLVTDPNSIAQNAFGLCGEAAYWNILSGRHPVAVANAATKLYATGACKLGNLSIQASTALLSSKGDYWATQASTNAAAPTTQAAWMLMCALRSTNGNISPYTWDGSLNPGIAGLRTLAAASSGGDESGWFRGTGFFATKNRTNATLVPTLNDKTTPSPAVNHAMSLGYGPKSDIAFMINENLLATTGATYPSGGAITASYPVTDPFGNFANHWVVLIDSVQFDGKLVHFSIWSWGKKYLDLQVTPQVFEKNYHGAVVLVVN